MGTIISRKRKKDGTLGHTALIRIKRDGVIVHQESETFDRKLAAKGWLKKRESELAEMGSLPPRAPPDPIFRDVITKYLDEVEAVHSLGKTKRQVLNTVKASSLGDLPGSAIGSKELVDFARERMTKHGVKPQTVGNYISHISAVFAVAEAAWGYPIRYDEIRKAKAVLKKLGMASKSRERKRRPTPDELDKLMKHFFEMQERRPHSICMPKIIAFGIFSTRRQEEITRIKWSDLDPKAQTVVVRDMKHPGQKIGNDVECYLPNESWRILQSMPRETDCIFPYNGDSISAAFTKACSFLGIEDLHFHDLRHDGVSRLFEMGWDIPQVSRVSGHRDWNSLRRYTHLKGRGDLYKGWKWLKPVIEHKAQFGETSIRPEVVARRMVRDLRRVNEGCSSIN
ncbi:MULTISPECIES: site-specific integrase [unclassified Nitrobacter]|uniref:site-specific integrase n=1 Tax=unclassified Nitrobacter TaxID=2620411 RepID=UPI00092BF6A1|nr:MULTISPECIES: site-specific integrase [unclassified Nitrobacter]MBN9147769.1 site-specific integrase [Nitrobacter sp.]OJV03729.1 MAG: integrase [Nitrobacter sp. 62-23]